MFGKIFMIIIAIFLMLGYYSSTTYGEEKKVQQKEAREQKIKQLKKEAEEAKKEAQKWENRVKKLEKLEKPATVIKKGADIVMEAAPLAGPKGEALKQIYKGTTNVIDKQGAVKGKK